MIGELLLKVNALIGHGLVLAWIKLCVLYFDFLDDRQQDLLIPLCIIVLELVVCTDMLETDLAWLSAFFVDFTSSTGILTAHKRERFSFQE